MSKVREMVTTENDIEVDDGLSRLYAVIIDITDWLEI
jgi:hypothetical protein